MNVFEAMGEWGYCKPCNRLVLCDDDGFLMDHKRSLRDQPCTGKHYKPWKRVPKELTPEQEKELTGIEREEDPGRAEEG